MGEAYNTGYEAARHGEPFDANPYPDDGSWDSEQWDQGWADAIKFVKMQRIDHHHFLPLTEKNHD